MLFESVEHRQNVYGVADGAHHHDADAIQLGVDEGRQCSAAVAGVSIREWCGAMNMREKS